jgi:hypothetical protein
MAAPERVQLLTGEGVFNADEVGAFLTQPARHAWASRYRTVAIMGPQSSGKSTLLNQLFGTAFVEMDAMAGRSRTTQGVWLAQAKGAEDPPLLVLDLEVRRSQHRRKFPRFPPEPRSHPLQPGRVGAVVVGRRSAGEDRRTRAGASTLAVFVKPRSCARTIRSTAPRGSRGADAVGAGMPLSGQRRARARRGRHGVREAGGAVRAGGVRRADGEPLVRVSTHVSTHAPSRFRCYHAGRCGRRLSSIGRATACCAPVMCIPSSTAAGATGQRFVCGRSAAGTPDAAAALHPVSKGRLVATVGLFSAPEIAQAGWVCEGSSARARCGDPTAHLHVICPGGQVPRHRARARRGKAAAEDSAGGVRVAPPSPSFVAA